MDSTTYAKALAALTGFLQILDDAGIRSEAVIELDLSKLDEQDAESLACDVIDQIEQYQED